MPVFDTPAAISVSVEIGVGNVRVTASDRTDTVVEVRPSDAADESDVQAAAQIRIDYADGTLRVTGPRRAFDLARKTRSVDLTVELPSDSRLDAHLLLGDVRATGRLGECRVKTTGHVWLERTGSLRLHTGFGHLTADEVTGDAQVSTGSGKIQIGEIAGTAEVKNSNGDTTIGAVGGDVRVRNANGAIDLARAGAGVDVKTSNGSIHLREVVRGEVVLATAAGDLDIGIAEGTAAWLEVHTNFGQVRNLLQDATRPEAGDKTVEVRGRTSYGDITVHRA
ncbi:DUF4097 family beta strand repeat-containing protein [Micromonospora sp. DT48]|uniref:DUF4097 family beta strand repeat-containing protein n=1 Tax=Micromonospora sp. DT48 TaxID=3393429 RepID=UPI003CF2ADE6